MKKGFVLFFGLLLCSCLSNYQKPYQIKDYAGQIPLVLPAKEVKLSSLIQANMQLPHVENLMPITPERALLNWGFIRLRSDYLKPYIARFIVEEASMVREELPDESLFKLQNYKYQLTYRVAIEILDNKNFLRSRVVVDGFVTRTQPMRSSVQDRDALMVEMLNEMEKSLDGKIAVELKQNLVDFYL